MKILDAKFVQDFIKMANDGFLQGWHERNGGNLSYRLKPEEVELIRPRLNESGEWTEIGTEVPGLAGEFFLVTGSGKYFRNIIVDPEVCLAIIEIDYTGTKYRIRWGLVEGGRPTSELPTHLMNHEVKKRITNGKHRVIYHAHTTNTIALTFVLPLDDQVFTREQLLDHVWGYEYVGDTRTVDVHIKRLRAKLPGKNSWSIATVWGVGYKFQTKPAKSE